jgi:hypothetical protein
VFVLPPWEVIYANDAEREQSFAEAVDVHARACPTHSRGERRLTSSNRLGMRRVNDHENGGCIIMKTVGA